MITDHSWRRFSPSIRRVGLAADACAYLNCQRPREEHDRANQRGDLSQEGQLEAKAARS